MNLSRFGVNLLFLRKNLLAKKLNVEETSRDVELDVVIQLKVLDIFKRVYTGQSTELSEILLMNQKSHEKQLRSRQNELKI